MPKNIPWEQKEGWCGRFERGDSVAMMAREYRKDPRTVQRGIDDVRRHRATKDAREALLRESLRHHLEDLLVLVERVARSVVSPPTHLELRFPGVEIAPFLDIGPVRVDRHGDTFDVVTLEVEQEFTWGLLKEHLGRDRTFRLLARWKQAFSEALNAHLVFRDGLLTVLEDFGLRISDDLLQPGTVRPAAAEELVKAAVSQILLEDPPYELQLKQGENGEFLLNRGTGGRLLPDSEA
ncbi:MAG: hypothetical protein O7A06_00195, partial [Acidobacteria bacterium]|nr:hypothetical protein [Acidobacteriota bacterium]